jgi:hypothetical protein
MSRMCTRSRTNRPPTSVLVMKSRAYFGSVFHVGLTWPSFRENTETAQPYPSDELSRLHLRMPPPAPFAESDTTTVPQWRTGKRTSCASADGPESSLFHHAQGSEGASHTPVRRSRSETPCARAWIQQAVAAWGVSGARLTHCRQALGSLGRSGSAAERTLLVSVEPVIQTRSNSGPCRTTECRGARACHPESFRHPRE